MYSALWHEVLRCEFADVPGDEGVWFIDLIGTGSEEDVALNFKYYASDEDRQWWLGDFPDYEMPARVVPPFDRDRHLPSAYGEQGGDDPTDRDQPDS